MNHKHNPQSSDGKHEDDAALTEFLASLMDYTPTIPDELVEHYLAKSGFQCPDVRLIRLVAVATQKFVTEVASDAVQHCKARQAAVVKDKRDKQPKVIHHNHANNLTKHLQSLQVLQHAKPLNQLPVGGPLFTPLVNVTTVCEGCSESGN